MTRGANDEMEHEGFAESAEGGTRYREMLVG